MPERSPSLLLSNAAQPSNKVYSDQAIQWHGGELSVTATGVFGGASVQLAMTPVMPPNGEIPTPSTGWVPDADWILLGTAITAPGFQSYGHINPCMLSVKVTASGGTTRIKALVG